MTVAAVHMWLLVKSLSIIIYCKMIERLWVQAAINLLLPLLTRDHFAINCRSCKRFRLLFSKQNNYPVLSENAGLWAKEAGYNKALILSGL